MDSRRRFDLLASHRSHLAAARAWFAAAGVCGRMPQRSAITAAALRAALPDVLVVAVSPGPRFRFRLAGARIAQGVNPTGRYLDEAAPAGLYRDHIVSLYSLALTGFDPVTTVCRYDYGLLRGYGEIRRSFFPLAEDPAAPDHLLVVQTAVRPPIDDGSPWSLPPQQVVDVVSAVIDAGAMRHDTADEATEGMRGAQLIERARRTGGLRADLRAS